MLSLLFSSFCALFDTLVLYGVYKTSLNMVYRIMIHGDPLYFAQSEIQLIVLLIYIIKKYYAAIFRHKNVSNVMHNVRAL